MSSVPSLIGSSAAIQDVREQIRRFASAEAPVLITGETGTGKELVARAIHQEAGCTKASFVPVNCGGIPSELVEAELFGARRGAYSQAYETRSGLVQTAQGGTLFLDEIDSLPMGAQPKLLRLLQEKEYRALGESRVRAADLRFAAASNAELDKAVNTGRFRADLFYRLAVLRLHMPPLRERPEDVPELVAHFAHRFCARYRQPPVKIPAKTLDLLQRVPWPGNVRELEHAVHRAVVVCDGRELAPGDFSLPSSDEAAMPRPPRPTASQGYHESKAFVIERFELDYVSRLLEEMDGNVSAAARVAKLDRRTFQRLMPKHGLANPT